jgi:hypothetical protein
MAIRRVLVANGDKRAARVFRKWGNFIVRSSAKILVD